MGIRIAARALRRRIGFCLCSLILVGLAPNARLAADPLDVTVTADSVFPLGMEPAVLVRGPAGAPAWLAQYRVVRPAAFLLKRPRLGEAWLRGEDAALHAAVDEAVRNGAEFARAGLPAMGRDAEACPPWAALTLTGSRAIPLPAGTGVGERREPLGDLPAGLYLVEVGAGDRIARTLVLVSDLTILTRRAADHLLVYAAERRDGSPVEAARVTIFDRAGCTRRAETDEFGMARLAVADMEAGIRVIAEHDGHICMADTEGAPRGDDTPPLALAWSADPVAAPGSTLLFGGLAPGGREFRAEGFDASGRSLGSMQVTPSPLGSFQGALALRADATPGVGTLWFAPPEGGSAARAEFRIAPRPAAGAQLEVFPALVRVPAGTPVTLRALASRAGGEPLAGAELVWSVRRGALDGSAHATVAVEENAAELRPDGTADITVTTRETDAGELWLVRATLVDPDLGRPVRCVARIEAVPAEIRLVTNSERAFCSVGRSARITVDAVELDGRPAVVGVTLERQDGAGVWAPWPGLEGRTGPSGRIVFELPLAEPGRVRYRARARDRQGRSALAGGEIWGVPAAGQRLGGAGRLELIPERSHGQVGDTARVLVLGPRDTGHVWLTAETDAVCWSALRVLAGGFQVVDVPMELALAPGFTLRASICQDNVLRTVSRRMTVGRPETSLHVDITPDLESYRPGADAGLTVLVADGWGRPVAAEVLVSVVDAQIPDERPGATEFFCPRRPPGVEPGSGMTLPLVGLGWRESRLAGHRLPTTGTEPEPEVPEAASDAPPEGDLADAAAGAFWSGTCATDAQGRVRLRFPLPARFATWRVRALAIASGGAVGDGAVELRTEGLLFLEAPWPAWLREGDRARLSVRARCRDATHLTSELRLIGEPGVSMTFPDTELVRGKVAFEPGAARSFPIQVDAREAGEWQVRAEAAAGQESVRSGARVQVLGAGGMSRCTSGVARGMVTTMDLALPDAEDAPARITLLVAPGRAALIAMLLDQPGAEPDGTCERALAGLIPAYRVLRALERGEVPHPRLAREWPGRLRAGLDALAALRQEDGGWGWRRGDTSDLDHTTDVMATLAELRAGGARVPEAWMREGVSWLRQAIAGSLADWRRLRVLRVLHACGDGAGAARQAALALDPATLAQRALLEWLLLAADSERVSEARAWVPSAQDLAGEAIEIQALGLEAQARLATEPAGAAACAELVATGLLAVPRVGWREAMALSALASHIEREFVAGGTVPAGKVAVRVNDVAFDPRPVGPTSLFGPDFCFRVPIDHVHTAGNRISLSCAGEMPLYYRAEIAAVPSVLGADAGTSSLRLRRSYFRLHYDEEHEEGSWQRAPVTDGLSPIDVLLVRLELESGASLERIVIEDALPPGAWPLLAAGAELLPVGLRLPDGARVAVAEDHMVLTVPRVSAGTSVFEIPVRLGVSGEFTIPAATAWSAATALAPARSASCRLRVE